MSLAWGEPETAVPCLLFTIVYMTTGWSGMHITGDSQRDGEGDAELGLHTIHTPCKHGTKRVATHTMC